MYVRYCLQFPLSARTFSPTSATMPNGATLGTTDASSISNLTNYSQLMVDARKSASVYSLVSQNSYHVLSFWFSNLIRLFADEKRNELWCISSRIEADECVRHPAASHSALPPASRLRQCSPQDAALRQSPLTRIRLSCRQSRPTHRRLLQRFPLCK